MLKSDDFDEKFVTRESICCIFYHGGLGWGGTRGQPFEKMLVFGRQFFQNVFFHERGRRGRSRREHSAKITAAAFSRA